VWIEQDRDLIDSDVVLVAHARDNAHARPEDWPIMPVDYIGLTLKPVGFFDPQPSSRCPT